MSEFNVEMRIRSVCFLFYLKAAIAIRNHCLKALWLFTSTLAPDSGTSSRKAVGQRDIAGAFTSAAKKGIAETSFRKAVGQRDVSSTLASAARTANPKTKNLEIQGFDSVGL